MILHFLHWRIVAGRGFVVVAAFALAAAAATHPSPASKKFCVWWRSFRQQDARPFPEESFLSHVCLKIHTTHLSFFLGGANSFPILR